MVRGAEALMLPMGMKRNKLPTSGFRACGAEYPPQPRHSGVTVPRQDI